MVRCVCVCVCVCMLSTVCVRVRVCGHGVAKLTDTQYEFGSREAMAQHAPFSASEGDTGGTSLARPGARGVHALPLGKNLIENWAKLVLGVRDFPRACPPLYFIVWGVAVLCSLLCGLV